MVPIQQDSKIEAGLAELQVFLGDRVSAADAVREHHSHGESTHPPGMPDLVCFPQSTDEVSRIVKISASKPNRIVLRFIRITACQEYITAVPAEDQW